MFCNYRALSVAFLYTTVALVGCFGKSANAQNSSQNVSQPSGKSDSKKIDELINSIEQQKAKLSNQEEVLQRQINEITAQQRALQAQRGDIFKLEQQLSSVTGKPVSTSAPSPGTSSAAQSQSGDTPNQVGLERRPDEKEKAPQVTTLADEGGVLIKKGTAVIEPSAEYSYSTSTRVAVEGFTIVPALSIGFFDLTRVDRNTAIAAVTGRYGLTNRWEINARVPYVNRWDSTLSRPFGEGASEDVLRDVDGNDLGDIEFGTSYQLNRGLNNWPFLIANLRYKSNSGESPFDVPVDPETGLQTELPTGSGFNAFQPSITAIFPSDPVVFYGNVGYLYNMSENLGGNFGEIDPGDSISGSFGMGFSLNDRSSFSLGYGHDTVFKTEQNGQKLPRSNILQIGSLDLGFSYRLYDNYNLNFNVGAGLTEDAPDVRLSMRTPVSFDLFK
jgi:hypothetical protein